MNTNCLIYKSGSKESQCKIYLYYKYAKVGSELVVIYYVDDCVYCYIYEERGKWFLDTL